MARPPTGQIIERPDKHGRPRYGLRFRAYGRRHYLTVDVANRADAETELENVLADVRRGIWQPPTPAPITEERQEAPTFHRFASEWVDRRRHEVRPRTEEHWTWLLSCHLLPFFASYPVPGITVELVDRYRTSKVREREQKLVQRPLGNNSINKSLALLARILDEAVEYGLIEQNPAAGKRRRLRPVKPNRTWLELHEVQAVLDAAGKYRALLATMILAGLRVGELTNLRWRHVDLAGAKMRVAASKTEAGVRVTDVSPMLLDELKAHKANARHAEPDDLVFCTSKGTPLNRNNIRVRVLGKAVERASATLMKSGLPAIQAGVTNHSLRRTFASLLYEAGASPAYVMSQMGHTSSALALEVYAQKMARSRDTGARMDALIRNAEWAQMGTNGASSVEVFSIEETKTAD